MKEKFAYVKAASRKLLKISSSDRTSYLVHFAKHLNERKSDLLEANKKDLLSAKDLSDAMCQRLKLDSPKIDSIVRGVEALATLDDPVGKLLSSTLLDEGLVLNKVSVPIGVLGIIFESRPDVIPQILSLAIRSGNAVILKGGKEAIHTNSAFMKIIDEINSKLTSFPNNWAILLEDRAAAMEMLNCPESIDLIIPRGSNALVADIMSKSKVPVLGHADGVCHIYVDRDVDINSAIKIIIDAKTQYPAACNAVEMLLVHKDISKDLLTSLLPALTNAGVTVKYPQIEDEWHIEYSDLILGIKEVDSLEDTVSHINKYGSHHTDVILSNDQAAHQIFLSEVDSACVFVNCSSRFADGQRFGFGAEVGISTGKLHARGPVGIEGLLTYQYRLIGSGQHVAPYTGDNPKLFMHRKL